MDKVDEFVSKMALSDQQLAIVLCCLVLIVAACMLALISDTE